MFLASVVGTIKLKETLRESYGQDAGSFFYIFIIMLIVFENIHVNTF